MISKLAELIWNETEGIVSYTQLGQSPFETDYLMKLLTTDDALAERYNGGHAIRYTREWPNWAHRQMETELFVLGLVKPMPHARPSQTYFNNLGELYREARKFSDRQEMETALASMVRAFGEASFQQMFSLTGTGHEVALDSIICHERMKRAETEEKLKKLG